MTPTTAAAHTPFVTVFQKLRLFLGRLGYFLYSIKCPIYYRSL